ncbi:MAG TPA: hypothetical protein VKG25_20620 [Bryobacteraceae bacterium]|nr:hypothetical protein [Bryobacteraceae bacterium]
MNAGNLESRARVSTSRLASWRVERWLVAVTVLSVLGLYAWYYAEHRQPSANNHRVAVMWLGGIGTALAVFAAALSIRKRLAYQGVGKLSSWTRVHVYAGIVAAFAIAFHSGFRSGGPLTALLLALFWLTVASGLLGWGLSRTVPRLLTALEENPAILEDLLATRAESIAGMQELAAGASTDFRELVSDRLMKDAASWRRILRFYQRRTTLAQELPAFQDEYKPALLSLREHEQRAFGRAVEFALRANKMNAELFLQRLLRGWLTFHLAVTVAMFSLAAIHIVSVLYY